jgi:hypothetical protein
MANSPHKPRIMTAALVYFAAIFALGFVFGVARTLALQATPAMDRTTAVLVELPLILAASWLIAGFVIRRFHVPKDWRARLAMGALALALLLAAEAILSLAAGRTLAAHFELYGEMSYRLGLLGQIAFGLIPLVVSQPAKAV